MLAEMLPVISDGIGGRLALDVGAGIGPDAAWLTSVGSALVALNWLRMYLPLVRAKLPQMLGNIGTERLGSPRTASKRY